MFGRKSDAVEAQAEILDAGTLTGPAKIVDGYAYGTFDYAVEVRLPGEPGKRTVARGLACTGCKPEPGDVIAVKWHPDGHATFDVHADERFAPEIVAKRHVDFATEKDALYGYLQGKGVRGVATLVAVKTARHRFQNVEVRAEIRVKAKGGGEFDTTLVDWVSESFPEFMPVVGSKRQVVFDPEDRSRVAWWEG